MFDEDSDIDDALLRPSVKRSVSPTVVADRVSQPTVAGNNSKHTGDKSFRPILRKRPMAMSEKIVNDDAENTDENMDNNELYVPKLSRKARKWFESSDDKSTEKESSNVSSVSKQERDKQENQNTLKTSKAKSSQRVNQNRVK